MVIPTPPIFYFATDLADIISLWPKVCLTVHESEQTPGKRAPGMLQSTGSQSIIKSLVPEQQQQKFCLVVHGSSFQWTPGILFTSFPLLD